jgi:hypothetical protein
MNLRFIILKSIQIHEDVQTLLPKDSNVVALSVFVGDPNACFFEELLFEFMHLMASRPDVKKNNLNKGKNFSNVCEILIRKKSQGVFYVVELGYLGIALNQPSATMNTITFLTSSINSLQKMEKLSFVE